MTETIRMQAEPASMPVRAYKDRVFRMIFKEKKEFLELYNAMNGSAYENPDDLVVTTLDNAIYMGIKNDVSFLLYDRLTLYEHQSTDNPNMPLRNLFYVSDIYSDLTKDANLYGSKLIRIPEPQFVVFYNGMREMPERFVLRLSDMYEAHSDHIALELETLVLNINLGCNRQLMERCQTLHDYAVFVDLIRGYAQNMPLKQAVELAIDECIRRDILGEFLRKNRAEVLKMSIYEYDEEKHMQQERNDAREEGWKAGKEAGIKEGQESGGLKRDISLICTKLRKGKSIRQIADDLEQDVDYVTDICKIAEKYAPDYDEEKIFEMLAKKE